MKYDKAPVVVAVAGGPFRGDIVSVQRSHYDHLTLCFNEAQDMVGVV